MVATVFTIGYQGKDLSSFLNQLTDKGIELVIDVREFPASRKRGFSKSSLSDKLQELDIRYEHLRELGSPKELREQLRQNGDFRDFRRAFSASASKRVEVLSRLKEDIQNRKTCFLCFEANAENCHRSIVVEELSSLRLGGLRVVHI